MSRGSGEIKIVIFKNPFHSLKLSVNVRILFKKYKCRVKTQAGRRESKR